MPPELQSLRRQLANYAGANVTKPATPYTGPLTPGIDPLALQAMSVMMGMMNKPYNMPPYGSMGGQRPSGGIVPRLDETGRRIVDKDIQPRPREGGDPYAPGNPWTPGRMRPRR